MYLSPALWPVDESIYSLAFASTHVKTGVGDLIKIVFVPLSHGEPETFNPRRHFLCDIVAARFVHHTTSNNLIPNDFGLLRILVLLKKIELCPLWIANDLNQVGRHSNVFFVRLQTILVGREKSWKLPWRGTLPPSSTVLTWTLSRPQRTNLWRQPRPQSPHHLSRQHRL